MKPELDLSVVPSTSKSEIITRIQQLVPPGSPEPTDANTLATLQTLTKQLIEAYKADGQLENEPFTDVRNRSIHLYTPEISRKLKGKVVLVTGGEGYVGAKLIEKLVELGVQEIVSVDKVRCHEQQDAHPVAYQKGAIKFYAADVRNYEDLQYIFEVEKPDIVFHLAAQRLPGLAEIKIRETISTSLLGTKNIIQLCEEYGVAQCVFSSTGKASRYYTTEVYAASKKLAEWQFAQAAQQGNVTYGMVRFTHMLENSSFCEQMSNKVNQGKTVNVHAPHRYVTAQNVIEAVHLLLNSLIFSVPGKLRFLTVRNLGWPTETLEVALYKILESGKDLPIYFQGLLPGYEEPFFLGQFDWSNPTEIHLLLNVLEDPFRTVTDSEDMIVTELAPFSFRVLTEQVSQLEPLVTNPEFPEVQLKRALAVAEREIVSSTFSWTYAPTLLKILKWGMNPKKLEADKTDIKQYRDILELLLNGLYGRLNQDVLIKAGVSVSEFDNLIASLSHLDFLKSEVAYLRSVSRFVREFSPVKPSLEVITDQVGISSMGNIKCA